MDANEYALKVTPAAKSLGMLLGKATWLGKGQRPTVAVIEPQTIEEKTEAAAKEKITEPITTAATPTVPLGPEEESRPAPAAKEEIETIEATGSEEAVFSSAAQPPIAPLPTGSVVPVLDMPVESRGDTVFVSLGELQHEWIEKTLKPQEEKIETSEAEKTAALELLRDPRLLDRILEDFARCGVVGEETNKLVSYLAVTSRLLESPLAILVQSSSAAGKSALMEAVLAMLPEEQRVQYSAMTGQSLFYMGETDLKHKVLAIVEEEGALRAAYALKLLQSEGVLTIASSGKDATTGRLITHQYRVEGPVMLFLTTTAIDLDEELMNRCLVLTVDEDRKQTQAIHKKQREAQTLEGLLAKQEREAVLKVHQNAQRLLKPLFAANPYARELTFLDSQTRTRRDHMKYLTLIRAIALLHQHQRPHRSASYRGQELEYIEVTKEDISTANRLAHEVLGRSLDELPSQTRRLLLLVDEMVSAECERQKIERVDFRFSPRDVRQYTGWGDTQLRVHLRRLEELEYLLVHRGGRGQSFVYELVFERREDSGKTVLPGLIEIEKLSGYNYDAKNAGQNSQFTGSTRPQSGGIAGGARVEESPMLAWQNGNLS